MSIAFKRTHMWRVCCFGRDAMSLIIDIRPSLSFLAKVKAENGVGYFVLLCKYVYARLWGRFLDGEFLDYYLYRRPIREYSSFISVREGGSVSAAINNEPWIFENKYETYKKFKEYFKRVVVEVRNTDEFRSFWMSHERFFFKPVDSAGGQGTRIIDTKLQGVDEFIKENTGGLAEELIRQTEEMASFNASSVNTIRVATFKYPNRVEIPFAYFRVGRSGSVCDNGMQGGVICVLDVETGKIVDCAAEGNIKYANHPDSGKQLMGYVIPEWDKAKMLCKKLALMSDNLYVAWDVANTDNGWVVVEGNSGGDFGTQFVNGIGVREKFRTAVKRMGVDIGWF